MHILACKITKKIAHVQIYVRFFLFIFFHANGRNGRNDLTNDAKSDAANDSTSDGMRYASGRAFGRWQCARGVALLLSSGPLCGAAWRLSPVRYASFGKGYASDAGGAYNRSRPYPSRYYLPLYYLSPPPVAAPSASYPVAQNPRRPTAERSEEKAVFAS